MNGNIGFLTSDNYTPPPKKRLKKGERSDSGGVWFVTALPVIGLFLEIFAIDKYAGIVLWVSVVVMIYYGCIADLRSIGHEFYESDEEKLRALLFFPPAYLYKRDKLRTGEGYKGIVLAVLTAAALFANGFSQGAALNEENIIPRIENSWVEDLDNFSGSSEDIVSERLESWFDEEYRSECSRSGEVFSIVFSGTHGGKSAEITIKVVHDGFAYRSLKASGVTIDGVKQEGDDLKNALTEIFISDPEENGEGDPDEEQPNASEAN